MVKPADNVSADFDRNPLGWHEFWLVAPGSRRAQLWGGDGAEGAAYFLTGDSGAVPANGPAANVSWRPLVAPLAHILDMTAGSFAS